MADAPNSNFPKIRTFASDLSSQRAKRETKNPTTKPTVEAAPAPREEVFMAQAPSATTSIKQESKPVPKIGIEEPIVGESETPKPEVPKKASSLPAFHELQDAISSVEMSGISATADSFSSDKQSAASVDKARPNIGYDSTVITDTVHKRFKLFPAIGTSLSNWFKKLTTKKKKKVPTYEVPDTERRKGVIQKATSKSGSAFTGNDSELREKIRRRQLKAEEDKKQAAAEKAAEPETTWSPYTDIGYNLLDSTHLPARPSSTWGSEEEAAPTPPVVAEEREAVVPVMPVVVVPKAVATPAPVEVPAVPTPVEPVPQAEQPVLVPVEEVADTQTVSIGRPKLDRYNTNSLAILVVAGISAVIAIAFLSLFVINLLNQDEVVTPVFTSTIVPSAEHEVLTVRNKEELRILLQQPRTASLVDAQVYTNEQVLVSPAIVIDMLGLRVLPSLKQSVTELHFLYLTQSPAIIAMEFVDEDTVRGSLLAWEPQMLADFGSLYNIPANQSGSFIDDKVGATDVRTFTLENGGTSVSYAIIEGDTVLIADSLSALSQLIFLATAE